jgi:hypothetical protein
MNTFSKDSSIIEAALQLLLATSTDSKAIEMLYELKLIDILIDLFDNHNK